MNVFKILLSNNLKVLSANCQGLQNFQKCFDVLNYFKTLGVNILCLQDTHWIQYDLSRIKNIWGKNCYINGFKTNARGVAILINDSTEFEVESKQEDKNGNMLCLNLKLNSIKILLINIYAPNSDTPDFLTI